MNNEHYHKCPNCKNNILKINDSHSSISNFPIDFDIFPRARNCKIYKVELQKNQYIFIPKNWFHWVFTEPNTLSIHYDIHKINFVNGNNDFFHNLKKNTPFYKTFNMNKTITHKEFINKSINHYYRAIFSETDDCIPVQKNNGSTKFFHNNTLKNIIDITIKKNYHTYIGNQKIDSDNVISYFDNINNFIDPTLYFDISYKSSVWFSLDKSVNSGLHCDNTSNIIHVIDGKKTIYLFTPDSYDNLYINKFSLLETV